LVREEEIGDKMSWAEKRIEEYKRGKEATWLERRMLEHANPVNCAAHIIASVAGIYGLWMQDWTWIITCIVIALIGHLYVWLKK
jgi:fatty acid desaturase